MLLFHQHNNNNKVITVFKFYFSLRTVLGASNNLSWIHIVNAEFKSSSYPHFSYVKAETEVL